MNRKPRQRRSRAGFSLLEITIALALALGVAGIGLAMLTQHTAFMSMVAKFSFLREDAPQINSLVSRIFGQAVTYRIYANKSDAFNNANATTTGGSAVRLVFRNPNGQLDQSALVFETINGEQQLNFYNFDGGWPSNPNWTVASHLADVSFANDTGVLLMSLTGPNAEEITYVGSPE